VQVNQTGTALGYSTVLVLDGQSFVNAIAAEPSGLAHVVGTLGAHPELPGITPVPYLVNLANDGSPTLVSYDSAKGAVPSAVGVGPAGEIFIAGTMSGFPLPVTPGAFQTQPGGKLDGFLNEYDSTGLNLFYSTYLGGSADDQLNGIAIDSQG